MCPGCIGSVLLLLGSAGSAGGLAAALELRSIRLLRSARERPLATDVGCADSSGETASSLRQALPLRSLQARRQRSR